MAVSKNTSPTPQLSPHPPPPPSLPSSLCYLFPLPYTSYLSLPPSLPPSLCELCQKVLQCWYSVKRACQQLDLSLDPVHIPSSPSLWSYFDPRYPAQKGIHLIDFSCFNLKVAWASPYLIEALIACFILLCHKNAARVSTPSNLLPREDRWFHLSLNHLYYPSLNPISFHLVTHFSYNCLSSDALFLFFYPVFISRT